MRKCEAKSVSLPVAYWQQLEDKREREGTSIAAQLRIALERCYGFKGEQHVKGKR